MKFLIDQNISHRLCALISELGTVFHIKDLTLINESDINIWEYARKEDYIIITHDTDFNNLAELFGHPPKIIWIIEGNLSSKQIAEKLKMNIEVIMDFIRDEERSIIYL